MSFIFDDDRFRKLLFSFPEKAIELLYEQFYHSLTGIANSLIRDPRVAEDIVQETFVHVWENHRTLGQHHERSIQHYLVRVVKNKSISHYKRMLVQQEQRARTWRWRIFKSNDYPIEQKIIQQEISSEIRNVIDTFPRREKECLLLRMDEEMTLDQMAVRMKVSRKAVERSMTKARKRLRKYWRSRK